MNPHPHPHPRDPRRRWPYVAVAGALTALLVLGAGISFGWIPTGGIGQSAVGREAVDTLSNKESDIVLPSAVLRDPCTAVPDGTIDRLLDVEGFPEAIQSTSDRPVLTCDWFGSVDDDPAHLHRIRIGLPVRNDADRLFAEHRERTEGASPFERVEVDRGDYDKAIAWASKDNLPQQTLVGIAVVEDGVMAFVEVTGTRLQALDGELPGADDRDELLAAARRVLDDMEVPGNDQVAERVRSERKRDNSVHGHPVRPDACAVPDSTLRAVVAKRYEKSEDSHRTQCRWSSDLEPDHPHTRGELSVSLQRFPDAVAASQAVDEQALHEVDGVAFSKVHRSETGLGRAYGEPDDNILIVGEPVPVSGTEAERTRAEMTLRVNDTVVHIEQDSSFFLDGDEPRPTNPDVPTKDVRRVARDLVASMT